jgi:hypothetical protein
MHMLTSCTVVSLVNLIVFASIGIKTHMYAWIAFFVFFATIETITVICVCKKFAKDEERTTQYEAGVGNLAGAKPAEIKGRDNPVYIV